MRQFRLSVRASGPTSRMRSDLFEDEIPNLVLSIANVAAVNVKYS